MHATTWYTLKSWCKLKWIDIKILLILCLWGIWNRQILRDRKDTVLIRDREMGEWRAIVYWAWFLFGLIEQGLEIDSHDGCPTLLMYLMALNCTFKTVEIVIFTLCYFTIIFKNSITNFKLPWSQCLPGYHHSGLQTFL